MRQLTWIVFIAPLLISLPSLANPPSQNRRICIESLVGARRTTKRKFAKEIALHNFNSSVTEVMRYIDSAEIISDLLDKKTRRNIFVVAIKYRNQNNPSSPLEKSLYEIVISPDGEYSVQLLNLIRKLM
jgi:hypothetical protein